MRKRHQILSLVLSAAMLATSVAPSRMAYAAEVADVEQNLMTPEAGNEENLGDLTQTENGAGEADGGELQPPEENSTNGALDNDQNITDKEPGNSTEVKPEEETKAPADGENTNAPEDVQNTNVPQETPGDVQSTETPQETPGSAQNTDAPQTLPGDGQVQGTPSVPAVNDAPSVRAEAENHIATYVGEIPQVQGVTWAEGVTEETFATAYQTVKVKDSADVEYTVEVVPKDLVYFIDSFNFAEGTVSAPYEAVKALVGEGLLNESYDQKKTDANTWGLVGEANVKGSDETTAADKDATGLYGNNEAGDELSYNFTLPAGQYTITTAHKEWWDNQNRTMDLSLTIGDADGKTYASLPRQDGGQVQYKSYT